MDQPGHRPRDEHAVERDRARNHRGRGAYLKGNTETLHPYSRLTIDSTIRTKRSQNATASISPLQKRQVSEHHITSATYMGRFCTTGKQVFRQNQAHFQMNLAFFTSLCLMQLPEGPAFFFIHGCFITSSRESLLLESFTRSLEMRSLAPEDT